MTIELLLRPLRARWGLWALVLLLLPSRASADTPAGNLTFSGLDFALEAVATYEYPLDRLLRQDMTVTNHTGNFVVLSFSSEVEEPVQTSPTTLPPTQFPQPAKLYLENGESARVVTWVGQYRVDFDALPEGNSTITLGYSFIQENTASGDTPISVSFSRDYDVIKYSESTLPEDWTVSGVVRDPDGNPVGGAEVKLVRHSKTYVGSTLPDGSFSFDIPSRAGWILLAEDSSQGAASVELDPATATMPVEVVLPGPTSRTARFATFKTGQGNVGFWRGDFSDDESKVLLVQGMEIVPNVADLAGSQLRL